MIEISVHSKNGHEENKITLSTNGNSKTIEVGNKADGYGSIISGGEFLALAVATCYSNDIYREARKRNLVVSSVEVTVEGSGEPIAGAPMENISYRAKVRAEASEKEILELMCHTDSVAEIHNTLRQASPVTMGKFEAENSRLD